jgi:post-segregation antitoxin (ccd killing protein)
MTYIPHGPKRPINLSLSEDLVREARTLTANLSEMVECLLPELIDAEKQRRAEKEQRIDLALDIIQAHQEKNGLWGQEFSTL